MEPPFFKKLIEILKSNFKINLKRFEHSKLFQILSFDVIGRVLPTRRKEGRKE